MDAPPKSSLTMRKNSPRYGALCCHCGQRIRVGKLFVVDPEDGRRVLHAQCYQQRQKAAGR